MHLTTWRTFPIIAMQMASHVTSATATTTSTAAKSEARNRGETDIRPFFFSFVDFFRFNSNSVFMISDLKLISHGASNYDRVVLLACVSVVISSSSSSSSLFLFEIETQYLFTR